MWSCPGFRAEHGAVFLSVFQCVILQLQLSLSGLETDGPLVQCPFWQLQHSPGLLSFVGEPALPSVHGCSGLLQPSRLCGDLPLLSEIASPRSPPFSALRQPHPWQPGQEIQSSSSSLSQKLERFYAEFLVPLSLPKPQSPDLPCANRTQRGCLDTFRNDLEPLLNTQTTGSLLAHHTPTHMLLVESGSVLLVFFFFPFSLSLPPFFMNTPHLSFPYYLSSGKLIRELQSQDRKGPWEDI